MNPAVDRHRNKVGQHRKLVAERVEQARKMHRKCRTDAERAGVLEWLMCATSQMEKAG